MTVTSGGGGSSTTPIEIGSDKGDVIRGNIVLPMIGSGRRLLLLVVGYCGGRRRRRRCGIFPLLLLRRIIIISIMFSFVTFSMVVVAVMHG